VAYWAEHESSQTIVRQPDWLKQERPCLPKASNRESPFCFEDAGHSYAHRNVSTNPADWSGERGAAPLPHTQLQLLKNGGIPLRMVRISKQQPLVELLTLLEPAHPPADN
jgi:hypothetical protein